MLFVKKLLSSLSSLTALFSSQRKYVEPFIISDLIRLQSVVLTLTSVRRPRKRSTFGEITLCTLCSALSIPWLTEWKAVRVEWRHFLCEPFVLRDWLTNVHLISLSFALSCRGNPEVTTPRLGNRSGVLTWRRNVLHKIISHITFLQTQTQWAPLFFCSSQHTACLKISHPLVFFS